MEEAGPKHRSWFVALTLSILFGPLGADRFYLGKVGTGIVKLITWGGFGIWWLIDVVLIATDRATDGQGLPLERRGRIAPRIRGVWLVLVCASPILLVGACVGVILVGVTAAIKSSGAYEVATEYVSTHELVIAEIGEVTGFGFLPRGSISIAGPTGEADLSISVDGERGNGTLYAQLVKELGEWKIIRAEFETSEGKRLNLVSESYNPIDQEIRVFLQEAVPNIFLTFSFEDLMRYSIPEFAEISDQVEATLDYTEQLVGRLRSFEVAEWQVGLFALDGENIPGGKYKLDALFENGPGTIELNVLKRNNKWEIESWEVIPAFQ